MRIFRRQSHGIVESLAIFCDILLLTQYLPDGKQNKKNFFSFFCCRMIMQNNQYLSTVIEGMCKTINICIQLYNECAKQSKFVKSNRMNAQNNQYLSTVVECMCKTINICLHL